MEVIGAMRRFVSLFIILLCCASCSVSAAEKALLFRFRSVGIDEELVDAVQVLLHGALEREGIYTPTDAHDVFANVECYDRTCAVELAREADMGHAVIGSLTRLGYKIIVQVDRIDTASGEVGFSAEGASLSEDDLDVVIKRLARSVSTGRRMEETAEVGMITEQEFEEPRRRESFTAKGFRAGLLWPTGGSLGGVNRMVAIDFAYQYDTPDFFLSGRSGLRWGGDLGEDGGRAFDLAILDAKIGSYLSRGDFAPFVSAGIGIHWVTVKERTVGAGGTEVVLEDSATGLMMVAGGGFTAFRTYNFQFQIDIDFVIMLEKLGVGEYPQGVLFTFCIKRGKSRD
jgi:hypothetical protein